jgi:hypothetical protein
MKTRKKKPDPATLRTRYEPPDIEEAVFAAQGLTGDQNEQVLIAAGLMGLSEDEVRPAVMRPTSPARGTSVRIAGRQRTVVVEHRGARASLPARRLAT